MDYEDDELAKEWWQFAYGESQAWKDAHSDDPHNEFWFTREGRLARMKLDVETNRRRELFMQAFGLKRVRSGRWQNDPLRRVAEPYSTGIRMPMKTYGLFSRWAVLDHDEMFLIRGLLSREYVYTAQPYGMTDEIMAQLGAICEPMGIGIRVLVRDGWHFPGRAPLVMFWRNGVEFPAQGGQP